MGSEEYVESYVKAFQDYVLVKEVPKAGYQAFDHLVGEIVDHVVMLPVQDQVRFSEEVARRVNELTKDLPGIAKLLLEPGVARQKLTEEIAKTRQESLKEKRAIAEKLVSNLVPQRIKEAYAESLAHAKKEVLEEMAEKKGEVKVKGHESCVYLEYGGKSIRVG